MTLSFTELRVVTSAAWLATDLRTGAPAGLDVVHDLGLDVDARHLTTPPEDTTTAWWCPGSFAMRLARTGIRPRLATPGPYALRHFEPEHVRRNVTTLPLSAVAAAGTSGQFRGPVFAKLADTKLAALPAQVYPSVAGFLSHVRTLDVPVRPDTLVIVSEPVDYVAEYRVFVHEHRVAAVSAYLIDGVTWDGFDDADLPAAGEASAFAADVADSVAYPFEDDVYELFPAGYVLDVGRDAAGHWSVIETNPAWSANPYWATADDADGVVATILASQEQDSTDGLRWEGEPALASRARPLPIRR